MGMRFVNFSKHLTLVITKDGSAKLFRFDNHSKTVKPEGKRKLESMMFKTVQALPKNILSYNAYQSLGLLLHSEL